MFVTGSNITDIENPNAKNPTNVLLCSFPTFHNAIRRTSGQIAIWVIPKSNTLSRHVETLDDTRGHHLMVEVISSSGTFASVKLISRDSRSAKTEENMTGWWFQPL
jgi:hypothetical protein